MTTLAVRLTRKTIEAAAKSYLAARKAGELETWCAANGSTMRGIAQSKQTIRINGETLPAKAIVAAASQLSSTKFSGGGARLGKLLSRLGFTLGAMAFTCTAGKVVAHAADAHANLAADTSVSSTYFASGSNRPDQIKGFASIGQAVGVAVPSLSKQGEDALHSIAGAGIKVFVDSGAFSEVKFDKKAGRMVVTKPISEKRWLEVMNLYSRLALSHGSDLFVVAPDMVGFQTETLARLDRWSTEIRSLIDFGVNVIVVAQKGEMSQADFYRRCVATLGTDRFVCGLPCNKAATSSKEIREFCASVQPRRLHLLGLGLRNPRAVAAAKIVAAVSPETELSLDSCLITESVGHTNGRASHSAEELHGPRLFTAARMWAKRLVDAGKTLLGVEELAIRLAWGEDQEGARTL